MKMLTDLTYLPYLTIYEKIEYVTFRRDYETFSGEKLIL